MKLGLRARGATAFALLALVVSVGLASGTYQIARSYLVDQRTELVLRQAGLNARALNAALGTPASDIPSLLAGLPTTSGSHGVARVRGEWYSPSVPPEREVVPDDLVLATTAGRAVQQRVRFEGRPTMIVGIPLPDADAQYFELAPLTELQRTLSVLARSLTAAAALTILLGAILGLYASRRVLKPLRDFSQAATEVGRGRLETRLATPGDPDLDAFGHAFNEMAESLARRTERDTRFASDVGHELRNPLTALTAAVDVLDARADDRARAAVEVIRSQVTHFRQLVLDLLEISHLDSGDSEVRVEEIDPRTFFESTVRELVGRPVEVGVARNVPPRLRLDRRRLERVLANLLDNAERHAGGTRRVEVTWDRRSVRIAVEDDGPGVPEDERLVIFDRFHRGTRPAASTRGSGLGLAIVAEHCRVHGGDAFVEPSDACTGARFVAVLREPPIP